MNKNTEGRTHMDFRSVFNSVPRMAAQMLTINSLFLGPILRGRLTWEAEGTDAKGPYYSRVISFPGGASGVTIGRGYDMKEKSSAQVIQDLTLAGVPRFDAELFSRGARLSGKGAAMFVKQNISHFPELSAEAQKELFEKISYPEMEKDVKRIVKKADVVKKYGSFNWDSAPESVKELVIDLRYRGDYTGRTREALQPLLVAHDWQGLSDLMNDGRYWKKLGVPRDRIQRRAAFARENL